MQKRLDAKKIISAIFPRVIGEMGADYDDKSAKANSRWGKLVSIVFALSAFALSIGLVTAAKDGASVLFFACEGAVFALLSVAFYMMGIGRRVFFLKRDVFFASSLLFVLVTVHAIAIWRCFFLNESSGALVIAAVLINVTLVPAVRDVGYLSFAFTIDAALVVFAFARKAAEGGIMSRMSVAVVATVGAVIAIVLSGARARVYIQAKKLEDNQNLLKMAVKKLVFTNELLTNSSTTDELTNLSNRRSFTTRLESYWAWSIRTGAAIAILLIDIDDFKKYNDNYGHPEGDKCLKAVADCLAAGVSRDMDFVARIGGEEFVIVVCDISEDGMKLVAERVRMIVEKARVEHLFSTVARHVTVSVGGALARPVAGDIAQDLINKSDAALYEAKRSGKNRCSFYKSAV